MARAYPKPTKFIPKNPSKYVGNAKGIISRSGLETKYMLMCDNNTQIKHWNSEEVVVPYVSPIDNKVHRYFIDLFVENVNGKKYLIEIKPKSQCSAPRQGKKKSPKTLLREQLTFAVNDAKWEAATKFAITKGCKFIIMTEKDIK